MRTLRPDTTDETDDEVRLLVAIALARADVTTSRLAGPGGNGPGGEAAGDEGSRHGGGVTNNEHTRNGSKSV